MRKALFAVRVVSVFTALIAAAPGAGASELAILGGYTNANPTEHVVRIGRYASPGASFGLRYFTSSGYRVSFGMDYSAMFFGGPLRRKPLSFNFRGGAAHHVAMLARFTNKDNTGPFLALGAGPAFFTGSIFIPGLVAIGGWNFTLAENYRIGAEVAGRQFFLVRTRDNGRHLTTINPSLYLSRKF